ncbi:hypothetical protein BH18ACT5_BH18ACT5_13110 [soil metagenome]
MTSSWQRPTSAWPLGAWIMAGVLAVVTGLGVSARVLSPGLLLDAISLWPGLVPAQIAGIVVAIRKGWRRRVGAIPPLLLITWIGLTGAAHIGAWAALPSSNGELIGPELTPGLASMTIATEGRLLVSASVGPHLYAVRYVRLGGSVGIPQATETTTENALNISVRDGGNSEWFQYAGWRLALDQATEWNLNLEGDVAGDLSGVPLGSLTLSGRGTLTLGEAAKATPVSVMGDFVLNLPNEAAATASGNVDLPATWTDNTSPGRGQGWIISVANGASLRINQP